MCVPGTERIPRTGIRQGAVSALLDYGFDVLGLTRIHLKARLFNSRAIHVYEKCGFREYGRTEERILMEVEKEKR
ncbi:MAG: GNAT family N-acetyltransferase [Erysipelotrichaceae bacterium]|nr:GNAT family N-acetyltransferase [Erysipelotrichaceae bacterium]